MDTKGKLSGILKNTLDVVASKLEQTARSLRRFSQNGLNPRQDFFGIDLGTFISSGAWVVPTTVVAGGLLFREQIAEVVTDIILTPLSNILDTIFGKIDGICMYKELKILW